MKTSRLARIIIPLLLLVGMVYFFGYVNPPMGAGEGREVSYSQLVDAINTNSVLDGNFDKRTFRGHFTRGNEAFTVYLPPENTLEYTRLNERLQAHGVRYGFTRPLLSDNLVGTGLSIILPLVVIFFFWMFFLRQAQRNGYRQP